MNRLSESFWWSAPNRWADAETADSGPTALKMIKNESFDLVLTDMKMPEMTGLSYPRIRDHNEDIATIMMTGWTVESAIEAMKLWLFRLYP